MTPWNKGLTKDDPRIKKIQEKRKKTMEERYGSSKYNNTKKREQTCIEKYGVDNVSKVKEFSRKARETQKETNLLKYGVESTTQLDETKDKMLQTFISRYGVRSCSQLPGVSNKISEKLSSKEVQEKMKNTCLDKYGVESAAQLQSTKDKIKTTKLLNHGNENYNNKEKEYETRRKNGTLSNFESSNEKQLKEKLISIYGKDNVECQYFSEEYPFKCDFYIKSEDLYIELNAFWTHGPHPFDENNTDDLKLLESLKQKDDDWSRTYIYTWTDLDVRKYKTAVINNLNFVMIYPGPNGNDIVYSHLKE